MNRRKLRIVFPSNQIVLILMGVVILYLAVDFGRQVILSQQYHAALLAEQAKVTSAKDHQAALQDQLEYALSPEASINWGLNQGWARQNEVPVVIVAPDDVSASESRDGTGSAPVGGNPGKWWELFFGTR